MKNPVVHSLPSHLLLPKNVDTSPRITIDYRDFGSKEEVWEPLLILVVLVKPRDVGIQSSRNAWDALKTLLRKDLDVTYPTIL